MATIILGTEGENKGLYRFPWLNQDKKAYMETPVGPGGFVATAEKPNLELIVDDTSIKQTPRALFFFNRLLHVLTRNRLLTMSSDDSTSLTVKSSRSLKSIAMSISEPSVLGNLVDQQNISGSFARIDGHSKVASPDLFMALFVSDPLKQETSEGCLVRFADGKIDFPQLIKEYNATGTLVANGNILYVPCGRQLQSLVWDPSQKTYQESPINLTMRGNILAVAAFDDYLVCTDSEEGFMVCYKGRSSGEKFQKTILGRAPFSYFKDGFTEGENSAEGEKRKGRKGYLPSQAPSVIISKISPDASGGNRSSSSSVDYYLLFGADQGQLLLYQLGHDAHGQPTVEYHNTIPFLSRQRVVNPGEDKDNQIRNLRMDGENISLTLRNMYLRLRLGDALNHSSFSNITSSYENQENEGIDGRNAYLLRMQEIYSLNRLCAVPRRIRTMEIAD